MDKKLYIQSKAQFKKNLPQKRDMCVCVCVNTPVYKLVRIHFYRMCPFFFNSPAGVRRIHKHHHQPNKYLVLV